MSSQTPASLGFRMPAEWDKHSGTMLSWPCNPETWPGERLDRVEKVFTRIVQEVTKREHLHLIINDDATLERAGACLGALIQDSARITLHKRTSNDLWARDFGPIFVRNQISGMYAITDWEYNAWGGKYPPFDSDNGVPGWFSAKYGIQRFKPGIVLEGGSIETNGDGVMLTTESVLLNPNRNPELSKAQIEQYLKDWLGQEKVIWLKNGLAGDDTDGHIDDLSRFLDSRTIMTMVTDDKDDVNYETLQENYELLKSATDQRGEPFEIVTVPMPQTRVEETTVDGSEHVPASYANFYFVNGAVLLPVYDPRYDEQVITLFKKHLPDHEIVAIPCADLVWGQGSIHCISQQLYGL
ncbi:MAG: agmatine deiminase family protein [Balneolales bacterium]|nr:agmatine deiminase family protein [Balneolales bacterium]